MTLFRDIEEKKEIKMTIKMKRNKYNITYLSPPFYDLSFLTSPFALQVSIMKQLFRGIQKLNETIIIM